MSDRPGADRRRRSPIAISVVGFLAVFVVFGADHANAEGILDTLQARLQAAQRVVRDITGLRTQQERKLDELRGTERTVAQELQRLDTEILDAVTRLRDAEADLIRIEADEVELKREIRNGLDAVQDRVNAYGAHLRSLYKATRTTPMEQLFAARDLSEAIQRIVALRAVAQVDTRLLGQLRRETASLSLARDALLRNQVEATTRRDEIDARRAQLEESRARQAETAARAEAETRDAETKLTEFDQQAKEQAIAIGALQQQYQAQLREIERQRAEEAAREAAARAEIEQATARAAATTQAAVQATAVAVQATNAAVMVTQTVQARALSTVYAQGTVVAKQTEVAFATRAAAVTRTPGAALPTLRAIIGATPVPLATLIPSGDARGVPRTPTPVAIPGSMRTNLLQPSTLGFIWPVSDPDITTEFGERNFAQSFHTGIDMAKPLETAIRVVADGIVLKVGLAIPGVPSASYGMMVVVAHGPTTATLYAHLDHRGKLPPVVPGQLVKRGQIVGYIGMTGLTSGPHVHFEVLVNDQPVNPRKFLP